MPADASNAKALDTVDLGRPGRSPISAKEDRRAPASDQLTELYRKYSGWLGRSVRRAGAGDESEDIVQETYIRIARYPADAVIRHPRALLLQVAQNVIRASARSARAAKNVQPVLDPMGPESVACSDQFETVVLKQTVLALPEIYRDVFLLSRFGGMTYDQIADVRGISVKTVEWRMSRALAMCAARMRD